MCVRACVCVFVCVRASVCTCACVCAVTDLHLGGGVVKEVPVVCLSCDESIAATSSNTASSTCGWGGQGRCRVGGGAGVG